MNWLPVVQIGVPALVGLWGLPVAWQHWSAERRWAARIERNGKIIAQVPDQPEVIRLLRADSARLAVRRAAFNAVPTRWGPVWLVVGGMTLWLIPFVWSLIANVPVTGTAEQWIRGGVAAIGGLAAGSGVMGVIAVKKLRRSWADVGGPENWKAKQAGFHLWSRVWVEVVEPQDELDQETPRSR